MSGALRWALLGTGAGALLALLTLQLGLAPGHSAAPAAEPPGAAPAPAGAAPAAAASPAPSAAQLEIETAQAVLRARPDDADGYVRLATAFMNRARENGDGSYYARADAAAGRALELDPQSYAALRVRAWIYTGQHRFAEARALAEQAIAREPEDPWNHGLLADALIELGEYEAAADAVDKMVSLRPGVPSYARVAHVRELFGDPQGAIAAMQRAVRASSPRAREEHAWCRTELGHLYFGSGQLEAAEAEYQAALRIFPDQHRALRGLARVRAAQQRSEEAIAAYRRSLQLAPSHEAALELGELLLALGRTEEAREPFALIGAIEQLNRANAIEPEPHMALYYADRGEQLEAALAMAQRFASERPTIAAFDALAWTLYKLERWDEALAASQKALRLGTQDALLHYHLGMIQQRLGRGDAARAALERALAINPHFHVQAAAEARRTLEQERAGSAAPRAAEQGA